MIVELICWLLIKNEWSGRKNRRCICGRKIIYYERQLWKSWGVTRTETAGSFLPWLMTTSFRPVTLFEPHNTQTLWTEWAFSGLDMSSGDVLHHVSVFRSIMWICDNKLCLMIVLAYLALTYSPLKPDVQSITVQTVWNVYAYTAFSVQSASVSTSLGTSGQSNTIQSAYLEFLSFKSCQTGNHPNMREVIAGGGDVETRASYQ